MFHETGATYHVSRYESDAFIDIFSRYGKVSKKSSESTYSAGIWDLDDLPNERNVTKTNEINCEETFPMRESRQRRISSPEEIRKRQKTSDESLVKTATTSSTISNTDLKHSVQNYCLEDNSSKHVKRGATTFEQWTAERMQNDKPLDADKTSPSNHGTKHFATNSSGYKKRKDEKTFDQWTAERMKEVNSDLSSKISVESQLKIRCDLFCDQTLLKELPEQTLKQKDKASGHSDIKDFINSNTKVFGHSNIKAFGNNIKATLHSNVIPLKTWNAKQIDEYNTKKNFAICHPQYFKHNNGLENHDSENKMSSNMNSCNSEYQIPESISTSLDVPGKSLLHPVLKKEFQNSEGWFEEPPGPNNVWKDTSEMKVLKTLSPLTLLADWIYAPKASPSVHKSNNTDDAPVSQKKRSYNGNNSKPSVPRLPDEMAYVIISDHEQEIKFPTFVAEFSKARQSFKVASYFFPFVNGKKAFPYSSEAVTIFLRFFLGHTIIFPNWKVAVEVYAFAMKHCLTLLVSNCEIFFQTQNISSSEVIGIAQIADYFNIADINYSQKKFVLACQYIPYDWKAVGNYTVPRCTVQCATFRRKEFKTDIISSSTNGLESVRTDDMQNTVEFGGMHRDFHLCGVELKLVNLTGSRSFHVSCHVYLNGRRAMVVEKKLKLNAVLKFENDIKLFENSNLKIIVTIEDVPLKFCGIIKDDKIQYEQSPVSMSSCKRNNSGNLLFFIHKVLFLQY